MRSDLIKITLTLALPFLSTRTLAHRRSRWRIGRFAEWRKAIPSATWIHWTHMTGTQWTFAHALNTSSKIKNIYIMDHTRYHNQTSYDAFCTGLNITTGADKVVGKTDARKIWRFYFTCLVLVDIICSRWRCRSRFVCGLLSDQTTWAASKRSQQMQGIAKYFVRFCNRS